MLFLVLAQELKATDTTSSSQADCSSCEPYVTRRIENTEGCNNVCYSMDFPEGVTWRDTPDEQGCHRDFFGCLKDGMPTGGNCDCSIAEDTVSVSPIDELTCLGKNKVLSNFCLKWTSDESVIYSWENNEC